MTKHFGRVQSRPLHNQVRSYTITGAILTLLIVNYTQ
jgi:hypothetical protein